MALTNPEAERVADTLVAKGASMRKSAAALLAVAKREAAEDERYEASRIVHSGTYSVGLHLLTGTAFELLLKGAYVLHGGGHSINHLRNRIGHDLSKALTMARQQGFSCEIENLDVAVELMSQPYSRHFFRYQSPAKFDIPDADMSLGVLARLEAHLFARFPALLTRRD